MRDVVIIVVGISVLVGFFAFLIFLGRVIKQVNNKKQDNPPAEEAFPEPVATRQKVTVTNQYCTTEVIGIKNPKTVKRFVIGFETENGDTLVLDVFEEYYEGFEVGQVGTLILLDGAFDSFVLDEDVPCK